MLKNPGEKNADPTSPAGFRQSVLNSVKGVFKFFFWLFQKFNFTQYSVVNFIDNDFDGFGFDRAKLVSDVRASSPPAYPQLSVRNALSFALLSKLAYERPRVVAAVLQGWGFEQRNMRFIKASGTKAYVVADDDVIIVVFTGTQPMSLLDYLTDWKVNRRVTKWGRIHHGFMDALDLEEVPSGQSAFSKMSEAIDALQERDERGRGKKWLYFCGHSLGGALAACAVQKLIEYNAQARVAGLYTFGMPMCGDTHFAQSFEKALAGRCFRFVHNDDLVPRLPLSQLYFPNVNIFVRWILTKFSWPLDYHHFGREFYLDTTGTMMERLERESMSTRSYLKRAIIHGKMRELLLFISLSEPLQRKLLRVFLPPFLNDHFPGDYVRALARIQSYQEVDHASRLGASASAGSTAAAGGGGGRLERSASLADLNRFVPDALRRRMSEAVSEAAEVFETIQRSPSVTMRELVPQHSPDTAGATMEERHLAPEAATAGAMVENGEGQGVEEDLGSERPSPVLRRRMSAYFANELPPTTRAAARPRSFSRPATVGSTHSSPGPLRRSQSERRLHFADLDHDGVIGGGLTSAAYRLILDSPAGTGDLTPLDVDDLQDPSDASDSEAVASGPSPPAAAAAGAVRSTPGRRRGRHRNAAARNRKVTAE